VGEIPPFDRLEPTLENMGNVFFRILSQSLARTDMNLEMLEISESPVRTYIVNGVNTENRLLIGDHKIKVSNLLMGNIISQSASHMISNFEQPEEVIIPVVPSPEPEREAEVPPEPPKVKIKHSSYTIPQKTAPAYQFIISFAFLLCWGALITFYLKNTGAYPSGSDIYGHLFKSDLLYHSIKEGDLYPLYTNLWYNGMQPFRYWAPIPYYLLAALQFIAGGDAVSSYLLFVFFAIVVGGLGWLLWGLTYNRMPFCTFLAAVWFFMPDNIRVFFVEGNFPRMVIAILLPYLFYFVWRFVDHKKKKAIVPVILIMSIIVLCHVMVAAMVGITTFIFLLIYSISQRHLKESFYVICGMLLSFALCGFWLYAALHGGLLGMDSSANSEVMQSLSTPVTTSLNPMIRTQGIFDYFYFGLSVFIIAITGLFLGEKKSHPGFYTALVIYFGTTTAMVTFLEKIPLNQVLWMTRFTPIVYAVFLLSLLEWRKCRRYAVIIIALVIILDCIPSVDLERYHSQMPTEIYYTLDSTKKMTKQRVSLLDVSVFDSYPSFMFSAEDPKTQYTFGWAWQGATTSHNIVMINTALEKGYYYYLFDRSLELGDDTVVVRKELIEKAKKTLDELVTAAQASGYELKEETNYTYIFHCNTPKTFGVATKFEGLSIGVSANMMSFEYPTFEEGKSENLSDYTFEELSKYKIIYLSGFTYDDRESVQNLLIRTANAGVKIIIDMNRIPVDPLTSRMSFFDITAQSICFTNRYPELMYKNKVYDALPFKQEYSTWNTYYLENVDHMIGYSWFQNKKLPFLATSDNPNIIFMGFNLLFHAMETNDQSILSLMSDFLKLEPTQLPERKVVPLTIEYQDNRMIINSPGGEINTTLAYQDNFRSKQKIESKNNLLIVEEPRTEINLVYPYLLQGVLLSIAGLLGIAVLIRFIFRERGVQNEKKPI